MKTYSNILDLKSIRLKIIEDCNWTCKFCHNEWDIEASSLQWDSMLEEALKSLKEQLNITEVHLTWWEPTLNRNIPNLVVGCNKIWLDTKLTTNWQFSSKYAKMLWESWLSSINFSIQSSETWHDNAPLDVARLNWELASKQLREVQNIMKNTNIVSSNVSDEIVAIWKKITVLIDNNEEKTILIWWYQTSVHWRVFI